jgi:hypothetical protein
MNQTLHQDFIQDVYSGEFYKGISETILRVKTTKTVLIEKYLKENSKRINQTKDQIAALILQIVAEPKVKVDITREALLFCAHESIIKLLGLSERLIKRHFPTLNIINFTVEHDPELGESWISADVEVPGEIEQVIKWEDAFVRDWVSRVPYPERNKIRLSCDIV